MDSNWFEQSRTERLIATMRVVLAVSSLLAGWLDLPESVRYAQVAYALLTSYTVYALSMLLLVQYAPSSLRQLRLFTHTVDLSAFSFSIYFAEAPANLSFIYFVFSLVCAMLRWQWQGVLWTSAVALGTFISTGGYVSYILHEPSFRLDRFIMHGLFLAAIATLLGYARAHDQLVRSEMSALLAWPRVILPDAHTVVQSSLEHASGILHAPRVLMAWEELEEPWLYLALWSPSEFHSSREPPTTFEQLVARPLVGTNFLCTDTQAPLPTVLYTSGSGLKRWHGAPLHPDLQARFAIGAVLSFNLQGEIVAGRLFFADKRRMALDDLALGQLVAHQVAADLDQFYLSQQMQRMAATEARTQLAGDLHDGPVQSLAGAAIQLEAMHHLLEENPQAARGYLQELQDLLTEEQRQLRVFIKELRLSLLSLPEEDSSLAIRLEEICQRVERRWGLRVELYLQSSLARIPRTLAREIYYMIHEALSNAARHAHASAVHVEVGAKDDHVRITVADNGHGFTFRGHYDLAVLTALQQGPMMLKQRVVSVGGSLTLDSSQAGTRLEIILPVARFGADNADSSSRS